MPPGPPSNSGSATGTLTLGTSNSGTVGFRGSASAAVVLGTSNSGTVGFSGPASGVISLTASAPGVVGFSGASSASVLLAATAPGVVGFSGTTSAVLNLAGSVATGVVGFSGQVTGGLELGTTVAGLVLNPGFVPTFVYFYTGTPLQFEIDESDSTSVLFSFLSVGFIVTIISPTGTSLADGTDVLLFTLQRYALPPVQPILLDPMIPAP